MRLPLENTTRKGILNILCPMTVLRLSTIMDQRKRWVIPDQIAALPVTRIESTTFAGNKTVTTVTIPETVTSIDDDLFSDMEKLKKVIVQSEGIMVKVPKRCIIVEDYPVYVDLNRGGGSNSGDTGQESTENGVTDNETTDKKPDEPADDKTVDKSQGIAFEVAGDAAEDVISSQDRPGISTEDNKLITVDDTGNLIEIDTEGNVKVIDREHKYKITTDEDDNIIITNENNYEYITEQYVIVKYMQEISAMHEQA